MPFRERLNTTIDDRLLGDRFTARTYWIAQAVERFKEKNHYFPLQELEQIEKTISGPFDSTFALSFLALSERLKYTDQEIVIKKFNEEWLKELYIRNLTR